MTKNSPGKYELTWDLEALLPDPASDAFRDELASFQSALESLVRQSEQIVPPTADAQVVQAWIKLLEDYALVTSRATDLNAFIGCHAADDAENKLYQKLEAQLASLAPLEQQVSTNLELALKETESQPLQEFLQADERLQQIEFFFEDARRRAETRLPKQEEFLAAELAVDGIHAWGRLYDRVSGELRIDVMEKGKLVKKSVGQVQFDSPQRTVRENNFFAAESAWSSIADTCADAVNHIAGTRLTIYRRLELANHLEVPCRLNRMTRKTLDAMWAAVSARKSCLTPYLQKKAAAFGLEKPAWYDLSAPYPVVPTDRTTSEIPYDTACDLIIDTFGRFSGELGDFAESAIRDRWIEAENRPGKRQGGFCTDFPTAGQSRIFMTYTDTADSMSTLAHELGHAYHSYVLRDQPKLLRGLSDESGGNRFDTR